MGCGCGVWQCIALVSHGPATSWRNEALLQIHPCDPVDSLVLKQPTQDNCFFAPPSVMDLVLRSLGDARSAEAAAEGGQAGCAQAHPPMAPGATRRHRRPTCQPPRWDGVPRRFVAILVWLIGRHGCCCRVAVWPRRLLLLSRRGLTEYCCRATARPETNVTRFARIER